MPILGATFFTFWSIFACFGQFRFIFRADFSLFGTFPISRYGILAQKMRPCTLAHRGRESLVCRILKFRACILRTWNPLGRLLVLACCFGMSLQDPEFNCFCDLVFCSYRRSLTHLHPKPIADTHLVGRDGICSTSHLVGRDGICSTSRW
jgi:hypothetical protein